MSIFPGAPASSPSSSRSLPFLVISTGALSGLLLALGITRQSLWIDESYVAWIVARDDLLSMYHSAIALHLGDALMPFYMLGMFVWTQAFGASELLLRLANLPFAVLFAAAMTALSAHLGRRWLWLPFLASPFLVFYMNEARAYMAVISLASVATVALLLYAEGQGTPRATVAICLTSCVLAFGVHMYSAFFLGSLVIFAGLEVLNSLSERQRWRQDWLKPLLISLPFFLLVAAYDVYSFLHGSRGMKGSASWKNLAFAFYEFLGFAGLGPPRNDLRAIPARKRLLPMRLSWPPRSWSCCSASGCCGRPPRTRTVRRCGESGTSCWPAASASPSPSRLPTFCGSTCSGATLPRFSPCWLAGSCCVSVASPRHRGCRCGSRSRWPCSASSGLSPTFGWSFCPGIARMTTVRPRTSLSRPPGLSSGTQTPSPGATTASIWSEGPRRRMRRSPSG